jgi:hypothetical protein
MNATPALAPIVKGDLGSPKQTAHACANPGVKQIKAAIPRASRWQAETPALRKVDKNRFINNSRFLISLKTSENTRSVI